VTLKRMLRLRLRRLLRLLLLLRLRLRLLWMRRQFQAQQQRWHDDGAHFRLGRCGFPLIDLNAFRAKR
jgi:hypothetical protein